MQKKEKKDSVASGFFWKFGERILAQVISFVVSLVLARLLDPEHYGAIAVVNIFITFANVFVSSSWGNSLIQKKDADSIDFSTVFYTNLALSAVLYLVLFFTAPLIERIYDIAVLTPALRVMGLSLFLSALNNVQHAYVSKKMIFRRFFFATLVGTIVSAAVGIVMAYLGMGIWALVAQYMTNKLIDSIVLLITVKWHPQLKFSFARLKTMFSYGWKLLLSELISTGYTEIRSLVVGIKYSSSDLAYYDKGQSFPKLLVSNINTSLQSVLFPKMSNEQDNLANLKALTRKSIKVSCYIIMPMMAGLALVAEPMVRLVLTEKWLPCVPFLQAYCVSYAFIAIQNSCLQVLKATGRSDVYLKLEILKKTLGIAVLLATMPFGTHAIAWGAVASNVFAALVNFIPVRKILNYTYREQFLDCASCFIPLFLMALVCVGISFIPTSDIILLVTEIVAGVIVYWLVSHLMKLEAYQYFIDLIKRIFKKIKRKG